MKYNIIFIGTPEYSVPTLEALIADERFNVSAVITAPDAPVGRKQTLTPPPVKVAAGKYSLQILQPTNIKSLPLAHWERGQRVRVDVIIVIAYGQIISKEILAIPKFGCLNLHASLLPKYRGASPIQAAIAAGDKITGVTLMKMDKGLDTGPIIAQEEIKIINCHPRVGGDPANNQRDSRFRGNDNLDTGESLHDKLAILSAEILIKYLPDYLAGKIEPEFQDNAQATYAPKLTRQSGHLDWSKSATEIERLVRAFYPWPGTWTQWNSPREIPQNGNSDNIGIISQGKILKIISVDKNILKINNYSIGQFFQFNDKLLVQCGKNALIVNKLQLEGKNIVAGKEFIQGHRQKIK